MNYYLDQEFHEYFKKPISWLPTIGRFNKPYHTIELISIGIVAEDGREYYAVCNEFGLKYAIKNKWLNENVLTPIAADFYRKESGYAKYHFSESLTLKNFLKWKGKSKKEIAKEVLDFVYPIDQMANYYYMSTGDHPDIVGTDRLTISDEKGRLTFSIFDKELQPELDAYKPVFYGYYADYDWVLFCSLYGTMMDLPKGFPMYCKDLQQMKDDFRYLKSGTDNPDGIRKMVSLEEHPNYPHQIDEHHALADAKWNKELHDFLKTL